MQPTSNKNRTNNDDNDKRPICLETIQHPAHPAWRWDCSERRRGGQLPRRKLRRASDFFNSCNNKFENKSPPEPIQATQKRRTKNQTNHFASRRRRRCCCPRWEHRQGSEKTKNASGAPRNRTDGRKPDPSSSSNQQTSGEKGATQWVLGRSRRQTPNCRHQFQVPEPGELKTEDMKTRTRVGWSGLSTNLFFIVFKKKVCVFWHVTAFYLIFGFWWWCSCTSVICIKLKYFFYIYLDSSCLNEDYERRRNDYYQLLECYCCCRYYWTILWACLWCCYSNSARQNSTQAHSRLQTHWRGAREEARPPQIRPVLQLWQRSWRPCRLYLWLRRSHVQCMLRLLHSSRRLLKTRRPEDPKTMTCDQWLCMCDMNKNKTKNMVYGSVCFFSWHVVTNKIEMLFYILSDCMVTYIR